MRAPLPFALAGAALLGGCSTVLGTDFDAKHFAEMVAPDAGADPVLAVVVDGARDDASAPPTNEAGPPVIVPVSDGGGCPGTLTACGETCIDLQASPAHCGSCERACPGATNGVASCEAGKCGISCSKGFADCDGNEANGCEPLHTFYQDLDGDGYGGAGTLDACFVPAGYIGVGGDCHDGNRNVNPGQTTYFATPYTRTDAQLSFDYDCSGKEDVPPSSAGTCGTVKCSAESDEGFYCAESGSTSGRGGGTLNATCGATLDLCSYDFNLGIQYWKKTSNVRQCR